MKENEIMIGDWVRSRYEYRGRSETGLGFKVDELIRNFNLEMGVWSDLGYVGYVGQMEGIPLTAEILEKNGFVYNDIPFVQGWEQFGLTLTPGGDGFRIACGQNVAMVIESVHELQHALRLCGIEKEITI